MPFKKTGVRVAACVLGVLWASGAWAQEVNNESRTIARDLAVQGAVAFEHGELEVALDRFNRAAELFPAPSISVMQARVLVELGRWVEALDRFHEASQFVVTASATEAYRRAQREAVEEAAHLEQQIPHLEIRVGRDEPANTTVVHLDGKVVPAVLLNVERPLNPGEHTIDVVRGGTAVASQQLTLVAGEHKLYTFDGYSPAAPAPVARPTLVATPPPMAAEQAPSTVPNWAMPVAFGVGGLGSVVAVFTGLHARGQSRELDAVCTPACPDSMQDTLSSYRTYRTVFYTSLGVGLAGLGVGTYLALTPTPKEEQPQAQLLLTLHGVSVAGRF